MSIPELTVVTLTRAISHEGIELPIGTTGVIVHQWKNTDDHQQQYEVEFANPPCVISLSGSDIHILV